ncbi:MAG: Gfo/Idh/MocA family oxidoreductase [Clostridia bacterium]|nr:Gfo/Idh/MocA family oxidoreductase [Clostridia bacterium]
MEKINFCLVGAGSIGRRHLRLLLEREDVNICVAEPYEVSRERIMAEYPVVKCYLSMEDAIFAQKIDAVILATPHGMHADMAIKALGYGLHVFCEKPMSDSFEECVAMLRAAEKSDKVFSVGFMFHFDPFIMRVKEIIDSGRIGKIMHYSSRFASYNILLCSVTKHQENTPYSLIMDCIHDTDLLYHLTGRVPDYAISNAFKAGDMELSSPQNVIDTLYRWKNADMAANIHFNYVEHPQVHALEIFGDKGYIKGDFMAPSITVGSIDGRVEHIELQRDFDNVYRAEWDHFIKAIRGEVKVENPASSAIFSTLLMQAQKEAAMSGKEVDIHEIAARHGFSY